MTGKIHSAEEEAIMTTPTGALLQTSSKKAAAAAAIALTRGASASAWQKAEDMVSNSDTTRYVVMRQKMQTYVFNRISFEKC